MTIATRAARLPILAAALLALAAAGTSAAELEAQYFVQGNHIQAWYKSLVKPPRGWVENREWTERYERLVLFEGGDMSQEKPFMYVRAHPADDRPLEDYISQAQAGWLAKLKDTTIEPLPDLERTGKPVIKLFLYRNPSQPDQAFELTAFMKDVPAKPSEPPIYFQVVLAAPKMEELERVRPAFMELLGNL